MKAFEKITGRAVPILVDNIDTDTLIPKQYLKSTEKTGFADSLFDPWRYDESGKPIPDFALNQAKYQGANILIAGDNFGCGSSREHAAWALQDYGIEVVIAGSYSPIFYMNWLNNGHLPIVMSKEERVWIASLPADTTIEIDLPSQKVIADGIVIPFAIEESWKARLLEGADAIDLTLKHRAKIEEYEKNRPAYLRKLDRYAS